MPDPALLTPLGIRMRDSLPPVLRDDPDYLGVIHACAKEIEVAQERIALLRLQLNPRTATLLLGAWEGALKLPIAPSGQSEDQRRVAIAVALLRLRVEFGGTDWEDAITRLIGAGWTYEEHDPDVIASPPANTIRITLPFAALSFMYAFSQSFIRAATPANTEILFAASDGFILDASPLDLTDFGGL
jgi:hypothetical protein